MEDTERSVSARSGVDADEQLSLIPQKMGNAAPKRLTLELAFLLGRVMSLVSLSGVIAGFI
jgi:hypothetical protein